MPHPETQIVIKTPEDLIHCCLDATLTTPATKRPPGRPGVTEAERLKTRPIRLNDRQQAVRKRIGDQAIREWLDKQAKEHT